MADPDNAVVLVADSEAKVLREISSTLEKAGLTVIPALGGAALHELCMSQPKPVKMAILDMSLPGNAELVEELYRTYPGIRILFTGSKEEPGSVRQIGRSGQIREFLRKPFRRSQLLGRVLQVLDAPMAYTA